MSVVDNTSPTVSSSVVLDYTSRDFDAIRSMLVGIGRGKIPEYVTLGETSDFGTILVELYAYMGDTLNYYIDRVGAEAFLGTAALRRSVLFIADMLGYTPVGQQAATVVLTGSLDSTATNALTLPAGTVVQTNSDATTQASFTLDANWTFNVGDTGVTITATEGTVVPTEVLGTSQGIPNADYMLENQGVVFNSIVVTSSEGNQIVTWDLLDNLVNARQTQSAFSTYVDDNGTTHVLFGDGSAGRIPPTGTVLMASYRYGTGSAANSIGAGDINTLVGTSQPQGFSFQNLDTPLGGADIETVESMRFSIPRTQKVADRAVTLEDFTALSLKVPGVGKCMSYGQVYSNVTVRIAPVGGAAGLDPLSLAPLVASVEAYLSDKVMIGSTVYVETVYDNTDQGWEDITIDMDLFVLAGYNRTETTNRVTEALTDALSFDKVDFGFNVSIGYVLRTVMEIEGVDWADLKVMTSGNSTDPSAVANVFPAADRIPRLRPQEDNGTSITQEYGLTIHSFGGLV
jgi:hypothetical protein